MLSFRVLLAVMVSVAALVGLLVSDVRDGGDSKAQSPSVARYPDVQVDYVILYAEPLRDAAMAWAAHRRAVGHVVRLVPWGGFKGDADPVRAARRTVHGAFVSKVGPHGSEFNNVTGSGYDFVRVSGREPGALVNGLRYLLILGDAPDNGMKLDAPPTEYVFDATRIPAEIHAIHKDASRVPKPAMGDHYWTIAPEIGDGKFAVTCAEPIAVGRVPARSDTQAREALRKTVLHETAESGDWQRKLSFFAGEGRFGAADALLERLFTQYADNVIEPRYQISMTYANPRSAWVCPPAELTRRVAAGIRDGSLVTTYIGHGNVERFDSMRVATGDSKEYKFTIGERDALVKLLEKRTETPTIMLIVACQTGCFDHPGGDSIGEALLFSPGGPAAILAGSRDTHPYSNIFVQKEFISALTEAGRGDEALTDDMKDRSRGAWPWRGAAWANARTMTVGAAHHAVKQYLLKAPADEYAVEIERTASMLFPEDARKAMNEAHLVLYNLLGDPAMRVRRASDGGELAKMLTPKVKAGERMEVQVLVPEIRALVAGEYEKLTGVKPEDAEEPFNVAKVALMFETWPSVLLYDQEKIDWSKLGHTTTPAWEAEVAKLRKNHELANDKVIFGPLEWKRVDSAPKSRSNPRQFVGVVEKKNVQGGIDCATEISKRVVAGTEAAEDGLGKGWQQRPLRLWVDVPKDMGGGGYRVRVVVTCDAWVPEVGPKAAGDEGKPVMRTITIQVPMSLDVEVEEVAAAGAAE